MLAEILDVIPLCVKSLRRESRRKKKEKREKKESIAAGTMCRATVVLRWSIPSERDEQGRRIYRGKWNIWNRKVGLLGGGRRIGTNGVADEKRYRIIVKPVGARASPRSGKRNRVPPWLMSKFRLPMLCGDPPARPARSSARVPSPCSRREHSTPARSLLCDAFELVSKSGGQAPSQREREYAYTWLTVD